VGQRERRFDFRLVGAVDAPVGGRITGALVVVAAHQQNRQVGVLIAPRGEGGERARVAAFAVVQQIAEDDESGRFGADERGRQSGEVGARIAFGQGDAMGAEGRCLADVRIGDEQRPRSLPKDRAFRQQAQRLASNVEGDVSQNIAPGDKIMFIALA
jgi:hypothetical protein